MNQKNKLILQMSLTAASLAAIIHLLTRSFQVAIAGHHMNGHEPSLPETNDWVMNLLALLPFAAWIIAFLLYRRDRNHSHIPLLNALSLTLSSFSVIAGAGGAVEFHFSIFMVIAIVAYYERISLIVVMTVLFAVQHVAGLYLFPTYVFGTNDYSIGMVAIHAVFLLLTSLATILQIANKMKVMKAVDEQNQESKQLFETIVGQLTETSEQLRQLTAGLVDKSGHTAESISGIAAAVSQLTGGLASQTADSRRSMNDMNEMSEEMNGMNGAFQSVAHHAKLSRHTADEGSRHIEHTIGQMDDVTRALDSMSSSVIALSGKSDQIGSFVDIISAMAEQTKLLALNASIEAARAGEQGKGFAVVAGEIRKLSNMSGESAYSIKEVLEGVQHSVRECAEWTEACVARTRTMIDSIGQTNSSFKHIVNQIHIVEEQVLQSAASSAQVAAGTRLVSLTMDEMAQFSVDSLEETKVIGRLTDKQVELTDHLADTCARLLLLSERIDQLINKIGQ
ncbi:methyl-accepting chemotaxis protein [Paenibacillus sp. YIM B09110]|uniref:methyl-accepting chemotaxis protein n=1 Tax=Paenibacillus sp. YIM B09110 TaxID=3126102 RepID=UPI00301DE971